MAHARLTRGRHTAKTPLSQVIPKREDLTETEAPMPGSIEVPGIGSLSNINVGRSVDFKTTMKGR